MNRRGKKVKGKEDPVISMREVGKEVGVERGRVSALHNLFERYQARTNGLYPAIKGERNFTILPHRNSAKGRKQRGEGNVENEPLRGGRRRMVQAKGRGVSSIWKGGQRA